MIVDERLVIQWSYCSKWHSEETIERLTDSFKTILKMMIDESLEQSSNVRPSDFPLADLNAEKLKKLSIALQKAKAPSSNSTEANVRKELGQ